LNKKFSFNELPSTSKELIEKLRQLDINQWEKESLSKDWNTKAKEAREKKAVQSLHKAMFGNT